MPCGEKLAWRSHWSFYSIAPSSFQSLNSSLLYSIVACPVFSAQNPLLSSSHAPQCPSFWFVRAESSSSKVASYYLSFYPLDLSIFTPPCTALSSRLPVWKSEPAAPHTVASTFPSYACNSLSLARIKFRIGFRDPWGTSLSWQVQHVLCPGLPIHHSELRIIYLKMNLHWSLQYQRSLKLSIFRPWPDSSSDLSLCA